MFCHTIHFTQFILSKKVGVSIACKSTVNCYSISEVVYQTSDQQSLCSSCLDTFFVHLAHEYEYEYETSLYCLKMFPKFKQRQHVNIVTGKETLVHNFEVVTKQNNAN